MAIKKHYSIDFNQNELAQLRVLVANQLENKQSKVLTKIWSKLI